MWENNKGTNEYDKSIVTCDVDTAQYDDETIKCERNKIKVPPIVIKVRLDMMLILPNITMKLSNMWKKNKWTTKYDKSTIICNVDTT